MTKKLITIIKKEIVLFVSLLLAIVSSIFIKPSLKSIDFKVIILLFNLMLIVQAFEKHSVLEYISYKVLTRFNTQRSIGLMIIITTGLFACIITNDVALITLVPITILIANKSGFNPQWIVILQTLAANIGSSLTPMGNPQNLFLYEYYDIPILSFFKITGAFVLIGFIWMFTLNLKNKKSSLRFELQTVEILNHNRTFFYSILFVAVLLSVFRVIDFILVFIVILVSFLILDKTLILKVDYSLLATFVCFFILIGNISKIDVIRGFFEVLLYNNKQALISSALVSQVISNVPSAILLSSFTSNYKGILLGVNIGGMGTLIASLASLISYKVYIKQYKDNGYLTNFHLINIISLFLFIIIGLLLL